MHATNVRQFALDIEAKGTQLYLALAAETENRLAKLLCYSLAAKEVEHARLFDTILPGEQQAGAWGVAPSLVSSVEDEIRALFTSASTTDLKSGTIPLAGYRSAMTLERTTYAAYKQFHDQTSDASEKTFLARVMHEENEHYAALANVYLYLTDNGDWMREDESIRWNWMNI